MKAVFITSKDYVNKKVTISFKMSFKEFENSIKENEEITLCFNDLKDGE